MQREGDALAAATNSGTVRPSYDSSSEEDDAFSVDSTWEEFFEELASGRYLAWLLVLFWVVVRRGWWQHMLVLCAFGYEDVPRLYSTIEAVLLRGACGLRTRQSGRAKRSA